MEAFYEIYTAITRLSKKQAIVGEAWLTTERVKKERKTKNVITETVIRETVRHVVLECGHTFSCVSLQLPKNSHICRQCGEDEYEGIK